MLQYGDIKLGSNTISIAPPITPPTPPKPPTKYLVPCSLSQDKLAPKYYILQSNAFYPESVKLGGFEWGGNKVVSAVSDNKWQSNYVFNNTYYEGSGVIDLSLTVGKNQTTRAAVTMTNTSGVIDGIWSRYFPIPFNARGINDPVAGSFGIQIYFPRYVLISNIGFGGRQIELFPFNLESGLPRVRDFGIEMRVIPMSGGV